MTIPKKTNTILIVAFHSFAGMGPYVISIVNSFKEKDNVRFFLIEGEDCYYSKNIKDELRGKATIMLNPTPSKFKTLFSVIFGFKSCFRNDIEDVCIKEGISLLYDLTGSSDYHLVKGINSEIPWLYTVHDLHPHEAKKSFFKEWRQNRIYKDISRSIKSSNLLITNSKSQYQELVERYPYKQCFITPFPSLVTDIIRNGSKPVQEIKGLKNYILFFGRIEEYKGLSILIEAFNKLKYDINLVIAGSGQLPCPVNDKRIILLNRYIDDEEIANLYINSKFVVYPYISATQSGVLAVASFFQTPIIASDVPFFKEVLGEDYSGLFKSGDIEDLYSKLEVFVDMSHDTYLELKKQIKSIYDINYRSQKQREYLISVFKSILFDGNN